MTDQVNKIRSTFCGGMYMVILHLAWHWWFTVLSKTYIYYT